MEHRKKKKHYFIKFLVLISIFCGIILYSASFKVTMELLDSRINDGLKVLGMETDFSFFTMLSDFSKTTINKTEYWIEIIKENIENNDIKIKSVPSIKITCAAKFPLKNYNITSDFGKRKDPFSGEENIHGGIDIAAEKGSDITAAWPGRIVETGFDIIYGNYIMIEHSKDFFTKYCHLSKINAIKNEFVLTKEKIGEVGNTGRSTGNHLHFEVIIDEIKIDPMECFEF